VKTFPIDINILTTSSFALFMSAYFGGVQIYQISKQSIFQHQVSASDLQGPCKHYTIVHYS
jgi:hypothetical protein